MNGSVSQPCNILLLVRIGKWLQIMSTWKGFREITQEDLDMIFTTVIIEDGNKEDSVIISKTGQYRVFVLEVGRI